MKTINLIKLTYINSIIDMSNYENNDDVSIPMSIDDEDIPMSIDDEDIPMSIDDEDIPMSIDITPNLSFMFYCKS